MSLLRLAIVICAWLLASESACAQGYRLIYQTSGSGTWTLPSDWPGQAYAFCVGAGGNGSARVSSTRGGSGGGGGEAIYVENYVVASNPTYAVAAGGSGSNTTLSGGTYNGTASTLTCHPGGNGTTLAAGAGGTGATGFFSWNGGAGLLPAASTAYGGGGGGAGGVDGNGSNATTNQGGAADNSGTASCTATTSGVAGVAGTQFDATHGSGSGGCGPSAGAGNGAAGGLYGGGGAGAGDSAAGNTGGTGASGIVGFLYYPLGSAQWVGGCSGYDGSGTFDATISCSLAAAAPTGSLIVVTGGYSNTTGGTGPPIISDGTATSYIALDNAVNGTTVNCDYYAARVATSPTTFTLTVPSSGSANFPHIVVDVYINAGSVDKHTSTTLSSPPYTANNAIVSGSVTTIAPGELIYGNVYNYNSAGDFYPGTLRAIRQGISAVMISQDILQAAAGPVTTAATAANSGDTFEVHLATFLPPTGPLARLLLGVGN